MNNIESGLFGLSGWLASFSIRNIAYNSIYKHDIGKVKRNIDKVERISDLTKAQRDFDIVEIIMKEALPIVIGLTSLYIGIASASSSPELAISATSFGAPHLIEAYLFHRKSNWQKYQKKK